MRIDELIARAPVSPARLAGELGITPRTLHAYARRNQAPPAARRLLEIFAGRVPWPEGERLRYCRGALYFDAQPDGVPLAEIPAYSARLRELDAVWRELRTLRTVPAQYLLNL